MLIIINGSYGVGKTTVSKKLLKVINNNQWVLLKSDCCWNEMVNKKPELALGGTVTSSNSNFLKYYRCKIENSLYEKNVIIDLTINNDLAKKMIVDYFITNGIDVIVFIIKSSYEIVLERTKNDDREDEWLLKQYNDNERIINELFKDSVLIDTSNLTIDETTNIIFDIIGKKTM